MQGCNYVFSKEEEFKEHLKETHKTLEHAVLIHHFNHWYIAQLFHNKFNYQTD
jgi:guanylate kinase